MDDFLHSFFDWHEILSVMPALLTEGLFNTLIIAGLSLPMGLVMDRYAGPSGG